VFVGTWIVLIVILAVLAAVISVPLFTVYKSSRCQERETRYSFVPPWDDPPRDCRTNQNGYELIRDELGLD
jgi:flagellar basal body-associated protein FliL